MDLPPEYGVHPTFNITDLVPFIGIFDEEGDHQDLRANPLQGGGDDVTQQAQAQVHQQAQAHIKAQSLEA